MLGKLIDRVFHIRLTGGITTQLSERLTRHLSKGIYNCHLIAVSINSTSGSITQSKNIVATLRAFSRQTSAPIYTFAEDAVFGPANIILASGNKVFANEFSLLGSFGFYSQTFGVKEFMKEWDLEGGFITAGKNKVRMNPFEDIKQADVEWMTNILKEQEADLKDETFKNRQARFEAKKLTREDIEREFFSQTFVLAQKAKEIGYVDDIKNFDAIHHERYHGIKVKDVLKPYTSKFGGASTSQSGFPMGGLFLSEVPIKTE
eukprot:TRINITY_DN1887_c0_g1_i1.p1 TRINITY_DN1887_c0_g1~~TRINITY_DN1887_c0_g1_i1.p1  ORF type:complete len:261 (-),score=52.37 TRINITY_DN1887_c0_g1_i1:114-896(-)